MMVAAATVTAASPALALDVLIVGGGPVGASLAIALQGSPLRVGLVDVRPALSANAPSQLDSRAIALAQGSRQLFESMGAWSSLAPWVTPITQVQVSQQGQFACTRMHQREQGVPALGYVLSAAQLEWGLEQCLGQCAGVQIWRPARVHDCQHTETGLQLRIVAAGGEQVVTTRLLVAAAGARSDFLTELGLQFTEQAYQQTAIVSYLRGERGHQGVAYERFTAQGPVALLPLAEQYSALVLSLMDDQLDATMALSDTDFLAKLQACWGWRLGRLRDLGPRNCYPLSLLQAKSQCAERVVLLGNAARSLHPVAGQGFNLALRDTAVLAEVLLQAALAGRDPGDADLLQRFCQQRQADQRRTLGLTDLLARGFVGDVAVLNGLRSSVLLGLELLPPLRQAFARQTLGMNTRLPTLQYLLPRVS